MKKIVTFKIFESMNDCIEMVFGDSEVIFKNFELDEIESNLFIKNGSKVKLTSTGFDSEWIDWVEFDRSFATISDGKLYVTVCGIPNSFNKKHIIDSYKSTLYSYIKREYGEFFELNSGEPICMNVEVNGVNKMV